MPAQRISSLLVDAILSRLLTSIRRRAARNTTFSNIVVPIDDLIATRLVATGMFEATQIEGVTRLLTSPESLGVNLRKPTGAFIDVGANIGIFTIAFSRFFIRTIAIEANPKTFSILTTNTTLRDLRNVECLCVAASDATKTSMLFVPTDGNLGHASMISDQHRPARNISIECRPLDDIVAEHVEGIRVRLIKIDVEGHEYAVLTGARRTLLRDQPLVLFEALDVTDAKRCATLLRDHGYRRFFIFKRGRLGNRLMEFALGLTIGLDVYAQEITIDGLRESALIGAAPEETDGAPFVRPATT